MLPSQQLLEKVNRKIMSVPNRKKESKRKIHYCLFLLGYKSGLRISEAVRFDLATKNKQGLYRISRTKGKKERFVYVNQQVVRELKKHNWQPNQTNRFNFYHFLQKIKRELNVGKETELTPHTLRRSFTTYHAESGMPLPLLQKWLGHKSIRTTSLYWRNIYKEPFAGKIPANDNDIADILAAKKWLEGKKEPPKLPVEENFPEKCRASSETKGEKPIISNKESNRPDNFLLINSHEKNPTIVDHQPDQTREISPPKMKKFFSQPPALTANGEKETILLQKIKFLEEQLKQTQTERDNLKQLVQQEKQRADQAEMKLKTIAKTLSQLQKINHYKQLAKEKPDIQAQIIQPPPWKPKQIMLKNQVVIKNP